ncbi:MAG TPA: PIN domain-containing protein [Bacteroidales bacterium]|nr:PIN domain-containing protein [Bacteroidales bacterium]
MKIIVDSNIVFSAILNTRSNIGQILTIGSKHFDFYTIDLLKIEILNHKTKIQKITGFSDEKFTEIYDLIISKIRFVDDIFKTAIFFLAKHLRTEIKCKKLLKK